jgi:hypothetical protein
LSSSLTACSFRFTFPWYILPDNAQVLDLNTDVINTELHQILKPQFMLYWTPFKQFHMLDYFQIVIAIKSDKSFHIESISGSNANLFTENTTMPSGDKIYVPHAPLSLMNIYFRKESLLYWDFITKNTKTRKLYICFLKIVLNIAFLFRLFKHSLNILCRSFLVKCATPAVKKSGTIFIVREISIILKYFCLKVTLPRWCLSFDSNIL